MQRADEATKAKRVTTRWDLDHNKDGIRARFVVREFKGDETMYDVFAPSSTPSTRSVIDYLSLKKSYHTFTADVTNAYFHVDEDEECYVDPPAEWLEQQATRGYFGDCGNMCMVGNALGDAGWPSWRDALKRINLTGVTQHHNSMQNMSWMFTLRFTWMISSMAQDRDLRWTWFKPTSHRKSDSKSGRRAKWA